MPAVEPTGLVEFASTMVVPREPLPFLAELLGAASPACANSSTRHRRSLARQRLAVDGWVHEIAFALNWLHGRPGGQGFRDFSLAQVQSLQFFGEQAEKFGTPTCTPRRLFVSCAAQHPATTSSRRSQFATPRA